MPRVDWDAVDESQPSKILPAGTYKCEVDYVTKKETRSNDEYWSLKLKVIEGPYAGKGFYDAIFWSEKALPRAKFIFSRLGVETKGVDTPGPESLIARKAMITVIEDEYTDKDGNKKPKNSVPWDGYERIESAPETPEPENAPLPDDEEIPF